MNRTLTKSYAALAAIAGNSLVAFADPANSTAVALATGAGSPLLGSSDRLDTAIDDMCDVNRGGIPQVRLGGTVAAGDPLTSDADGKAIKAVAAAGTTVWIVGYADAPGVADDIVDYLFAPGVLHEG